MTEVPVIAHPGRPVPPASHDPNERHEIARVGTWQLRQFAPGDTKLPYFTTRGFLHVQLWHEDAGISILTPSRLTAGRYEAWLPDGQRVASPVWRGVVACLPPIPAPTAAELRAIERWFVVRHEPPEVRLLRTWWAAVPGVHGRVRHV